MAIKITYCPNRGFVQEKSDEGGFFLSGSMQIEKMAYKNVTVTGDYDVGDESVIFANCVLGDVTLTLPGSRSARGDIYHMKKIDSSANFLIISTPAGQTIDGEAALMINSPNTTTTVTYDGANWFIL